ncbi:MAG: S9 family peptidase [Chloroflexi bacterium]|nr:S9 family peptidase [Chloroflexota bacterium]
MPKARRRPIEAADLCRIAVVDDPQLSPDGRTSAYVVRTIDAAANAYRSAIWTVPFGGGAPTQLTNGEARDRSPRWSPDGQWIAFLSDRGAAKGQIFVIPTTGGEARQVTSGLREIEGMAWSPDSARLAFTARVLPPDARPMRDGPAPPVVREITRITSRYDGKGWLDGRAHLFVVEREAGSPRQVTDGDWDDGQPCWSPDGRSLAFASNRRPDRDWNDASDIWTVGVGGRRVKQITRGGHSLASPAWSPDGAAIACVGHASDAPAGANARLWLVPATGGDPICLTASVDLSLGSDVLADLRAGHGAPTPTWTKDAASLRFLASDRGSVRLYEIGTEGGTPRTLVGGDRALISFSGANDCLTFVATDPLDPGTLFAANKDGSGERPLVDVNRALLDSLELASPERLEIEGADGEAVEGWLIPGRGRGRRPLILEIHGGPHGLYGNAFFHEFQVLAASGYHVLYTNPRGSRGYGERFCSEIAGGWGDLDYRDLMAAVDVVVKRPDVDPKRLGVAGGSYGGFMTNWIVGHTDRFTAAVTMRCLSNFVSFYGTSDIGTWFGERELCGTPREVFDTYVRMSPLTYVERVTTPILIMHSEQDLRCPVEQAEQWFVSLRRLGKTAEFLRFPEENHNLSRSGRPDRRLLRLARLVEWFDRWLK